MKTFSIEEIRNYLKSQDSLGDIYYNLSEENIAKANNTQPLVELYRQMMSIRKSDEFYDEEKFDNIFALAKQAPHIDYCDPDTSYEEDMDAYLQAFKDYLVYDLDLEIN